MKDAQCVQWQPRVVVSRCDLIRENFPEGQCQTNTEPTQTQVQEDGRSKLVLEEGLTLPGLREANTDARLEDDGMSEWLVGGYLGC